MASPIQAISNSISSFSGSATVKNLSKRVSALGSTMSKGLDSEGSKLVKFIAKNEPTNHDNAFIPMATLMIGTVIVPRVITAAKRNPNDKQATDDEIKEILFRDVQTVAIVLFLLKAVTTMISAIASKAKGLPMTTVPYEKLFNNTPQGSFFEKVGANAREFVSHPFEKLKTLGKNILATVNPTGKMAAMNNAQFVAKYSGFSDLSQISKMLDSVNSNGGNKEKVFKKAMDSIISEQKPVANAVGASDLAKDTIKELEKLASEGPMGETFKTLVKSSKLTQAQEEAKRVIVDFFKSPKNAVVQDAINLNAYLNGGSLLFESAYLGFGLPALNQIRLEKKYLNKNPQATGDEFVAQNNSQALKMQEQEVKLFHNFVAK